MGVSSRNFCIFGLGFSDKMKIFRQPKILRWGQCLTSPSMTPLVDAFKRMLHLVSFLLNVLSDKRKRSDGRLLINTTVYSVLLSGACCYCCISL